MGPARFWQARRHRRASSSKLVGRRLQARWSHPTCLDIETVTQVSSSPLLAIANYSVLVDEMATRYVF